MAGSPFLALAERDDLDYAERVAPGAQGRFPLPHGETSELVGGMLPGGYGGIAARLRRAVDDSEEPVELTLVVTPPSERLARRVASPDTGLRRALDGVDGAFLLTDSAERTDG